MRRGLVSRDGRLRSQPQRQEGRLHGGLHDAQDILTQPAEVGVATAQPGAKFGQGARGIIPGPRLLVSTLALTITGGHMNNAGLNPDIPIPEPASLTDSREAMVAEVRRQIKYGADWIKLYATGTLRHVNPTTLEPLSQVSVEEVRAVVEEARRWGRDVAAHAYGGEGANNAIRGGVRSIEHGMLMNDETIKLMVEHGTYWCPTLGVYLPEGEEDNTELRRRIVAHHREVFQKAMRAGVKKRSRAAPPVLAAPPASHCSPRL